MASVLVVSCSEVNWNVVSLSKCDQRVDWHNYSQARNGLSWISSLS